jgi:hypothetical protein
MPVPAFHASLQRHGKMWQSCCGKRFEMKPLALAFVAGATGAVGRFFVRSLLCDPRVTCVAALVRTTRSPEGLAEYFHLPPERASRVDRLLQISVDLEHDDPGIAAARVRSAISERAARSTGLDLEAALKVGVSTIGLYQGSAGSLARYRFVEIDVNRRAALVLKELGVRRFVFLSGKGASLKFPFWPIAYMRVKAEAERAIREVGFEHSTMLRPGFIRDRGIPQTGRFKRHAEWFMQNVMRRGISAADIARVGVDGLLDELVDMPAVLEMSALTARAASL